MFYGRCIISLRRTYEYDRAFRWYFCIDNRLTENEKYFSLPNKYNIYKNDIMMIPFSMTENCVTDSFCVVNFYCHLKQLLLRLVINIYSIRFL